MQACMKEKTTKNYKKIVRNTEKKHKPLINVFLKESNGYLIMQTGVSFSHYFLAFFLLKFKVSWVL